MIKPVASILLLSVGIFASCNNQQQNTEGKLDPSIVNNPVTANSVDTAGKAYPKITFREENFDFGKIKQGEKVQHVFTFKNTGKADLIISGAEGSCGCTIPEYSKEPVKPGMESAINVVFNSEGKSGIQHKTVTVIANTYPNLTKLTFTGEVLLPSDSKK